MSIKTYANRVLGGVFQGAQIKSEPKAPTDLNVALVEGGLLLPTKTMKLASPMFF